MAWTEEQRQAAMRLWSEGKSAAYIAAELGSTITRNAVLGMMHRSGLKSPKPNPHAGVRQQSRRRSGARATQQTPWRRRPSQSQGPVEEVLSPIQCKPVGLIDACAGDCRWPLNDSPNVSEFRFCGAPVWPRSSFCPGHYALVYRSRSRHWGAA